LSAGPAFARAVQAPELRLDERFFEPSPINDAKDNQFRKWREFIKW